MSVARKKRKKELPMSCIIPLYIESTLKDTPYKEDDNTTTHH